MVDWSLVMRLCRRLLARSSTTDSRRTVRCVTKFSLCRHVLDFGHCPKRVPLKAEGRHSVTSHLMAITPGAMPPLQEKVETLCLIVTW